jgi:hypothetical protein
VILTETDCWAAPVCAAVKMKAKMENTRATILVFVLPTSMILPLLVDLVNINACGCVYGWVCTRRTGAVIKVRRTDENCSQRCSSMGFLRFRS